MVDFDYSCGVRDCWQGYDEQDALTCFKCDKKCCPWEHEGVTMDMGKDENGDRRSLHLCDSCAEKYAFIPGSFR